MCKFAIMGERLSKHRDHLDGYSFRSPYNHVVLPGRVLLWIQYMFPSKGFLTITKSARHARSPIMVILYSAGFYLFLTGMLFALLSGAASR